MILSKEIPSIETTGGCDEWLRQFILMKGKHLDKLLCEEIGEVDDAAADPICFNAKIAHKCTLQKKPVITDKLCRILGTARRAQPVTIISPDELREYGFSMCCGSVHKDMALHKLCRGQDTHKLPTGLERIAMCACKKFCEIIDGNNPLPLLGRHYQHCAFDDQAPQRRVKVRNLYDCRVCKLITTRSHSKYIGVRASHMLRYHGAHVDIKMLMQIERGECFVSNGALIPSDPLFNMRLNASRLNTGDILPQYPQSNNPNVQSVEVFFWNVRGWKSDKLSEYITLCDVIPDWIMALETHIAAFSVMPMVFNIVIKGTLVRYRVVFESRRSLQDKGGVMILQRIGSPGKILAVTPTKFSIPGRQTRNGTEYKSIHMLEAGSALVAFSPSFAVQLATAYWPTGANNPKIDESIYKKIITNRAPSLLVEDLNMHVSTWSRKWDSLTAENYEKTAHGRMVKDNDLMWLETSGDSRPESNGTIDTAHASRSLHAKARMGPHVHAMSDHRALMVTLRAVQEEQCDRPGERKGPRSFCIKKQNIGEFTKICTDDQRIKKQMKKVIKAVKSKGQARDGDLWRKVDRAVVNFTKRIRANAKEVWTYGTPREKIAKSFDATKRNGDSKNAKDLWSIASNILGKRVPRSKINAIERDGDNELVYAGEEIAAEFRKTTLDGPRRLMSEWYPKATRVTNEDACYEALTGCKKRGNVTKEIGGKIRSQEISNAFDRRTNIHTVGHENVPLVCFRDAGADGARFIKYIARAIIPKWSTVPRRGNYKKMFRAWHHKRGLPGQLSKIFVEPLWKRKGWMLSSVNYRPISLASPLIKIIGDVVGARLDYMMRRILHRYSFGFLKHRGISNMGLSLMRWINERGDDDEDDWVTMIGEGDACRAFDTFARSKLFAEYGEHGLPVGLMEFVQHKLNSSHTQVRVQVGDEICESKSYRSPCGGTQGEAETSKHWKIYMNKMMPLIEKKIKEKMGEGKCRVRVMEFADNLLSLMRFPRSLIGEAGYIYAKALEEAAFECLILLTKKPPSTSATSANKASESRQQVDVKPASTGDENLKDDAAENKNPETSMPATKRQPSETKLYFIKPAERAEIDANRVADVLFCLRNDPMNQRSIAMKALGAISDESKSDWIGRWGESQRLHDFTSRWEADLRAVKVATSQKQAARSALIQKIDELKESGLHGSCDETMAKLNALRHAIRPEFKHSYKEKPPTVVGEEVVFLDMQGSEFSKFCGIPIPGDESLEGAMTHTAGQIMRGGRKAITIACGGANLRAIDCKLIFIAHVVGSIRHILAAFGYHFSDQQLRRVDAFCSESLSIIFGLQPCNLDEELMRTGVSADEEKSIYNLTGIPKPSEIAKSASRQTMIQNAFEIGEQPECPEIREQLDRFDGSFREEILSASFIEGKGISNFFSTVTVDETHKLAGCEMGKLTDKKRRQRKKQCLRWCQERVLKDDTCSTHVFLDESVNKARAHYGIGGICITDFTNFESQAQIIGQPALGETDSESEEDSSSEDSVTSEDGSTSYEPASDSEASMQDAMQDEESEDVAENSDGEKLSLSNPSPHSQGKSTSSSSSKSQQQDGGNGDMNEDTDDDSSSSTSISWQMEISSTSGSSDFSDTSSAYEVETDATELEQNPNRKILEILGCALGGFTLSDAEREAESRQQRGKNGR